MSTRRVASASTRSGLWRLQTRTWAGRVIQVLLFFEDSPRVWTLREPNEGEKGGVKDVPPAKWKALRYPPLGSYGPHEWPGVADRDVPDGFGAGKPAIYGAGDETRSVYGEDGKPYRFKEGSKKGQMSELKHRMEQRFVEKNKAAWPVKVDVTY